MAGGGGVKQVVQSYRTGELSVRDVPVPAPRRGEVLVATAASVVSVGTERAMLEMARKSLLGKALARPDLVRQVLNKARAEGPLEAYRQAMGRLEAPTPLGYSSSGTVLECGDDVSDFAPGQRVACAGAGFASHAEVVAVPAALCARIPDAVAFDAAAFGALGGTALHAVRLAKVTVGDRILVIGLGLVGQLAVQVLRASGAHVLASDPDEMRAALAREHGAEVVVAGDGDNLGAAVLAFTDGHGVDATIILAATDSDEPLRLAAEACRERGRIVATGTVGLDVPRAIFFDRELELVVSRAWGPGLFDPEYIERGLDYPYAFARWTARRNLEEFLALCERGQLHLDRLVTHRFPIERALDAYALISDRRHEQALGVVLTYPGTPSLDRRVDVVVAPAADSPRQGRVVSIALVGPGQFARGTLLPVIRRLGDIRWRMVAATRGVSAENAARRFGFESCTTDSRQAITDKDVDAVLITTRHDSHAALAIQALEAGKHVFVEKPLALTPDELAAVQAAHVASGAAIVMVGFNRRFSPFTEWMRQQMPADSGSAVIHCRVNAGAIPSGHWTQDPVEGGGRVLGEVCHFVDLVQALAGARVVRVQAETAAGRADDLAVVLRLADGSLASIVYTASGDKAFARERVEVFRGGAAGVIDDFSRAAVTRGGRTRRLRRLSVDRGHRREMQVFFDAVRRGGPAPVPFAAYVATTLATLAIETSRREGRPVEVAPG
ncbi:MAG: bi-domain-containing oxidoreductase [Candidatus Rokubacteria bacterium]|nr:bi-domain-containing oxidoreductase [Candidatus Rokubacteria bacterium]